MRDGHVQCYNKSRSFLGEAVMLLRREQKSAGRKNRRLSNAALKEYYLTKQKKIVANLSLTDRM